MHRICQFRNKTLCFEVFRKRLLDIDEVSGGVVELDAAASRCGAGEKEGETGGGGGVLEVHLCPFASGKIVPVRRHPPKKRGYMDNPKREDRPLFF